MCMKVSNTKIIQELIKQSIVTYQSKKESIGKNKAIKNKKQLNSFNLQTRNLLLPLLNYEASTRVLVVLLTN